MIETFAEAEQFLYEQLPMFQRIGGGAYKKDLSNTLKLLSAVNNPHKKGQYVHIAGTNGKGSTASMLASILMETGLQVGLFTSPHLSHFSERISINGRPISEEAILGYVNNFLPLIEDLTPSFFELTTAMAFQYFHDQKVDIAIMEVGMGGRLDSTNVITPKLSIITQIGLDHQQFLGDTLEEIAMEKAGIIKDNVPVLCSVKEKSIRTLIAQKANAHNASFYYPEDNFQLTETDHEDHLFDHYKVNGHQFGDFDFKTDLKGKYQRQNVSTVLGAVALLNQANLTISLSAVIKGLGSVRSNTGLKGRWQYFSDPAAKARIIIDGGHNEAAIEAITQMLNAEKFERLHIVFGCAADKSIEALLVLLPRQATYYFTQAKGTRAVPAKALFEMAHKYQLKGQHYDDVKTAFLAAVMNSSKNDLIFVGGSNFVISELPGI